MRRALERLRAALGRKGGGGSAETNSRNVLTSSASASASTVPCTITLPNGKAFPSASPRDVAFRMPAEFEPHDGCWVAWPRRADVWRGGGAPAKAAFAGVVRAIRRFEPVTVVADKEHYAEARAALPENVQVVEMPHDDSWLRDTAPTFVHARVRAPGGGCCPAPSTAAAAAAPSTTTAATTHHPPPVLMATDWRFNGWGDLYGTYERDKQVARLIAEHVRVPRVGVDMVLEGGSIHVDGQGTCLTTEECLLHPNRNPALGKSEVEAALRRHLGVRKVIWLPLGLYADHDTNGHVDNFACFARPGVVLLAWTDDKQDPQHAISNEALAILERERDARGRRLEVIKLPCPPVLSRTQEEYDGLDDEGKEHRKPGERLAASYVNFYVANGGVVAPAFGGDAASADAEAAKVLRRAFPGREVVQVPTREIVLGGGNIHCITQQQPTQGIEVSGEGEEELFLPFAE